MKPMTRWGWIAAIVAVMMLVGTLDADARTRRRRVVRDYGNAYTQSGFQLYFGLGGQDYDIEGREYDMLEDIDDDEPVFFFGAAYGLDRNLALYLEFAGSEFDTRAGKMAFGYAHLGFKYAFATGPRHRWQPYAKASLGVVFLWEDDDRHYTWHHEDGDEGYFGPAIGFGMGLDRFISGRTALFAEVGVLFGEFDHIVVDGKEYDLIDEIGVSSGRVLFGLRFGL